MALLTNHSGLCADTMFVLSRLFSHEWSSPAHHNTALVHVDRFLTRVMKSLDRCFDTFAHLFPPSVSRDGKTLAFWIGSILDWTATWK